MKILHLSDIHYDINRKTKFNELLSELKECINEEIDLIFITGDLINRGNAGTDSSDKGFKTFDEEFIYPLLEHFKIRRNRIILSPGNHDIDRDKIIQISELGLQKLLIDDNEVTKIINEGIKNNFYQEYSRIESYKDYVKKFYENSDESKITLFHDTHLFNIENIRVGVTSFNTAWRCSSSKEDHGKIILGLEQCLLASEEVKNCEIKIGLMHHELSFLQESDYNIVGQRLKKHYDMLCFGHVHTGINSKYHSNDIEVISLTSPGFCTENMFTENDKYNVGFSIINIEKNGIVDVVYYKWDQKNVRFYEDKQNKINVPLKLKSFLEKNKLFSSGGTIIEKSYERDNNIFKNDTVSSNINEIRNYQDKIISTNSSGILYTKINEIKKILEKIDGYNLFSNDLEFNLLYADKIINNDKIIYSKFENIFINSIINTDKIIKKEIIEEIINFLEEWLNKICINTKINDIVKILEKCYNGENKLGMDIIIQLIKDKKSIQKFVDDCPEKRKKEIIASSFILPITYICRNNIKYYRSEPEREDINKYYIDREIDENIYNYFIEHTKTIVYGKIEIGKTSSVKKIINKLNESNKLNICLYFSLLYQSLQENIKAFIELCNNRLIININDEYLNANDANIDEVYTNILNKICENLIIEYKDVYIVIDDIDNNNMGFLNFIINIKSKCHFLIIINEKILNLNFGNQNANYIQYPNFTANDIKKFMNLDDEIANSLSHFDIDFKIINDINNKYIDVNRFINERRYNINSNYFLKANQWLHLSQNYKEEVLILLSVFSKLCPINIEHIQSYLLQSDIYIKKPYIKQILFNNEEQITHNDFSKIKLKDEEFIKFLCTDYFSQYDVEIVLKRIYEWISKLDKQNSSLIAYVLINAENVYGKNIDLLNELQQNLNKILLDKGNGELLYSIGKTIYTEFVEHKEKAVIYIEKASDDNYIRATEFLIKYFMKQNYYSKAKKLILQALNFNSEIAKHYYTFGILEEKFVDEDDTFDKAMELLYDLSLSAKNPIIKKRTMLLYSINTIEGLDSKITYNKAIENIKLLAEEDSISKVYHARNLINSDEDINIKEAEIILQHLSNNGLIPAKIELIKLYINKLFEYRKAIEIIKTVDDDSLNRVDAIILDAFYNDKFTHDDYLYIFSYIEDNLKNKNEQFIISYSIVLLYGNKKYQNIKEGKKWLEYLVEKENKSAMYLLGSYLVDYEIDNINNGVLLLEKAAILNSSSAQLKLAKVYLNSDYSYFNYDKGMNLYYKIINRGSIEAILEYNKYILKNDCFKENEKLEAENKLSKLAENGNIIAIKILSKIYLDKKLDLYNEYKGEYYLTIAAHKGDIRSIGVLSQKYLYGIGLNVNIKKAVELLMIGVNKNDAFCMTILSKAIIEGIVFDLNKDKGKELLLKACELNDYLAKMYYGYLLCAGNSFEQNKILGEKFLYEASEVYDEAKLILSKMKLDGKYLKKDKIEGLNLLKNAVDNEFEEAEIEYAERLIDGDQIEADDIRGLSILRKLINLKSNNAKVVYAQKLLSQKFGEKESEARNILTELLDNDKHARRLYAINLLERKLEYDLTRDEREEKAINLLQKNVLEDDKLSMHTLGVYYLEGDKITQNVMKGIELFELGASKEEIGCLRDLGNMLLRGELVDRNIKKGTNLLYDACQRGDLEARFMYAKYNIEGCFLEITDIISGWDMMNKLVEDSYIDAKLYMASAYIKGSYKKVNTEYGINIFEELVKEKNETACIDYSNILLSGQYIKTNLKKSQDILKIALNKPEAYNAKYEKIQRMYLRRWKNNSIKKAAKELETLANSGSKRAKFELAIRQITGNGVAKNEKQGNEILKNIYKDISTFNASMYGAMAYRLKAYDVASNMFNIAIRSGKFDCRNSLAYMIRKKQYTGNLTEYNIPDLLKPLCDAQYPIALMNQALYLIEGTSDDRKWREADELVKRIKYYDDCFEWWHELMEKGDDEGKLVIAWLIRNNTYTDIKDLQYDVLIENIDKKVWNIPLWF